MEITPLSLTFFETSGAKSDPLIFLILWTSSRNIDAQEGTDWQSMTHQSYFIDCLCLSALLIKYSLLGNALPVHPSWLIRIPSPWLWNLSHRSNGADFCFLPRQIFQKLPGVVQGDVEPEVLLRLCWQPQGSHSSFCLEKPLCLHQCSESQPANSVKVVVEIGRGLAFRRSELEQWQLIRKQTSKHTSPNHKQKTTHVFSSSTDNFPCGSKTNVNKVQRLDLPL